MESEESLQVKRRYTDHTTWEPRIGAFASIQRALGVDIMHPLDECLPHRFRHRFGGTKPILPNGQA